MSMSKIDIDDDHLPKDAVFWASFATDSGKHLKDCSTVTLYENPKGELFLVEDSPGVDPTHYEPIEAPWEWLKERKEWLKAYIH